MMSKFEKETERSRKLKKLKYVLDIFIGLDIEYSITMVLGTHVTSLVYAYVDT